MQSIDSVTSVKSMVVEFCNRLKLSFKRRVKKMELSMNSNCNNFELSSDVIKNQEKYAEFKKMCRGKITGIEIFEGELFDEKLLRIIEVLENNIDNRVKGELINQKFFYNSDTGMLIQLINEQHNCQGIPFSTFSVILTTQSRNKANSYKEKTGLPANEEYISKADIVIFSIRTSLILNGVDPLKVLYDKDFPIFEASREYYTLHFEKTHKPEQKIPIFGDLFKKIIEKRDCLKSKDIRTKRIISYVATDDREWKPLPKLSNRLSELAVEELVVMMLSLTNFIKNINLSYIN
jgi:hypothetical protein